MYGRFSLLVLFYYVIFSTYLPYLGDIKKIQYTTYENFPSHCPAKKPIFLPRKKASTTVLLYGMMYLVGLRSTDEFFS